MTAQQMQTAGLVSEVVEDVEEGHKRTISYLYNIILCTCIVIVIAMTTQLHMLYYSIL